MHVYQHLFQLDADVDATVKKDVDTGCTLYACDVDLCAEEGGTAVQTVEQFSQSQSRTQSEQQQHTTGEISTTAHVGNRIADWQYVKQNT